MVSKNDLSALKIQPKNTLEKLQQMQEQSQAGIELPLGSKA